MNGERWVSGWRRYALITGMLAYPAVTAFGVAKYTGAVAGYAVVAVFCVCYGFAIDAIGRGAWRRYWWLVGAMAALLVAALPFAHADAFFLCSVVVPSVAAHRRRPAVPLVAVSVLACLVVPGALWGEEPAWGQAVALVFTVLTAYAFAETIRANRALVEARAEVARLASAAERARIARDLHDLLGHSLTAITVKSDLARRLGPVDARRSLREIAEVEHLARQALADVRAAVSGYREVTLAGELALARELLRAVGVTADLPRAVDVLDPGRAELFGWAVREGVTNVARHARATTCAVTVTRSSVEITDDGAGSAAPWGSGLTGLRDRVTAAGGTVEAGPWPPGWRLRVSFEEDR